MLSKKKKIVFDAAGGYIANAKYITREYVQSAIKYYHFAEEVRNNCVWVLRDMPVKTKGGIELPKVQSLDGYTGYVVAAGQLAIENGVIPGKKVRYRCHSADELVKRRFGIWEKGEYVNLEDFEISLIFSDDVISFIHDNNVMEGIL